MKYEDLAPETREQLERYQAGRLADTELTALKNRIKTDEEFARAVGEWETFHRTAFGPSPSELAERERLRSRLRGLRENPSRPLWSRSYRTAAVAAGVVILILGGVYLFTRASTPWPEVVAEYRQPLVIQNARMDSSEGIVRDAEYFYSSQRYEEALPLLITAVERRALDSTYLFYAGISALYLDRYDEAATHIRSAPETFLTAKYRAARRYYLALAELGGNKVKEAVGLLTSLETAPSPYAERAERLLQRIADKNSATE